MAARQLLPHSEPNNTTRAVPLHSTPPATAGYAIRASIACLECRSCHLKCDAHQPSCSQCRLKNIECAYPKSRRIGPKSSRKMPQKRVDHIRPKASEERESNLAVPSPNYPASSSRSGNPSYQGSAPSQIDSIVASSSQTRGNNPLSEGPIDSHDRITDLTSCHGEKNDTAEKLINRYYNCFHDAHPFILPKTVFMDQWRYGNPAMQSLILTMQFVGSMYAESSGPEIRSRAFQAVSESSSHPNGFVVQAYLLLAIALHCNDELVGARESLDVCIRMAIDLGMGTREYAGQNGAGNPVIEESWRRTWWMIYISDCLFAGIRASPTIMLRTVISTVDLPCEDENYKSGDIPNPHTQAEYSNRDFAEQEMVFSSFSYLIEAAQILGSALALYGDTSKPIEKTVAEVDTTLVSWSLNLPKEKSQLVRPNGEVDELLFAARVIINTGTVHLHRPSSQLDRSPLESGTVCRFTEDYTSGVASQAQPMSTFHTAKALIGAKSTISLFALPVSLSTHSPLLLCYLGFSTIAYLAGCRYVFRGGLYQEAKDSVRVSIGAFKHYQSYFPISKRTLGMLRGIARDVYELGDLGTGAGKKSVGEDRSDGTELASANSEMFAEMFEHMDTADPWLTWPSNMGV